MTNYTVFIKALKKHTQKTFWMNNEFTNKKVDTFHLFWKLPTWQQTAINKSHTSWKNREHQNCFWNVTELQEISQSGVRKLQCKQQC